MEERQRIFLRRQAGEAPPWTRDPILQRFRFCNVYRNQDRVTRWLHDNWLVPYADHPNLWFACCLFRQINWPDTARELGFPEEWNPRRFVSVLERRAKRGIQNFNGAYMIRSLRNGAGTKPRSIAYDVLNPVWKGYWFLNDRQRLVEFAPEGVVLAGLQSAHDWLTQFPGWGGFMAYEAITDMRWTRYLSNAPDINTWANPGPGAKRGLNRLYGRPVRQGLSVGQALEEMREIRAWVAWHRDPSQTGG